MQVFTYVHTLMKYRYATTAHAVERNLEVAILDRSWLVTLAVQLMLALVTILCLIIFFGIYRMEGL